MICPSFNGVPCGFTYQARALKAAWIMFSKISAPLGQAQRETTPAKLVSSAIIDT
jgi:hypothetical protein